MTTRSILPRVPAHVPGPDLAGSGPDGDAERVAQTVGDGPARVGVGRAGVRVVGEGRAGVGVHAQDRSVERRRIGRRPYVLRAQGSSLRGRWTHGPADTGGRIATGIHGTAVLAVVGEVEARAVAGGDVERAVGAEGQAPERVARVLLAPVLDQDLLGAGGVEAREPAGDHTAVAGGPWRRWAAVTPPWRRGRVAEHVVVRVEHVDERPAGGEARIEREAEHAAVPEVVHARAQVGVDRGGRVGDRVEDLDQAALLGDEDAPVRRESDPHRVGQADPVLRVLKAAGRVGRRRERVRCGRLGDPGRGARCAR